MKTKTREEVIRDLQEWIPSEYFQVIDSEWILVEEIEEEGRAAVRCSLPTQQAIELPLEGKNFSTLRKEDCADGIYLVLGADNQWELHIIECKRTIKRNKWDKIKKQFRGAIQRALAIVASVGVQVARIKVYTAYRTDELQSLIMSQMVLAKTTPESTQPPYTDWLDERLSLWYFTDIVHEKIPLNDQGDGQVVLQCI